MVTGRHVAPRVMATRSAGNGRAATSSYASPARLHAPLACPCGRASGEHEARPFGKLSPPLLYGRTASTRSWRRAAQGRSWHPLLAGPGRPAPASFPPPTSSGRGRFDGGYGWEARVQTGAAPRCPAPWRRSSAGPITLRHAPQRSGATSTSRAMAHISLSRQAPLVEVLTVGPHRASVTGPRRRPCEQWPALPRLPRASALPGRLGSGTSRRTWSTAPQRR